MADTPILPEEDSPDLTDGEVAGARVTTGTGDLSKFVVEELKAHPGLQLDAHELRRRKPHLYWRIQFIEANGDRRALVFQADWLK